MLKIIIFICVLLGLYLSNFGPQFSSNKKTASGESYHTFAPLAINAGDNS